MIKVVTVLLIEDNPGDVDLAKESLESSKVRVDLKVASDGEAGLAILQDCADAGALPDVVLLDLNLPGMSGQEVLQVIRENALLKHLTVVVLTSSELERDIAESYNLGANAYVTKPVDLTMFRDVVRKIEDFWFTIVRFPTTTA